MYIKKLVVLFSIAALFTISTTSADDTNWYSGYSCNANEHEGSQTILYHWGAAYNKSDSTHIFRCEVRRDKGDKGVKNGWIRVIDNHPEEFVKCRLTARAHVRDKDREFIFTNIKEVSTKNLFYDPGFFVDLQFDDLSIIPEEGVNRDHVALFLDCWVPGVYGGADALISPDDAEWVASGIIAYKIHEYE